VEFSSDLDATLSTSNLAFPSSWDRRLALWISNVFSPPLLAIAGLLLAAFEIYTPSAWLWTGYYIILAIFIPVLYIIWKVRRGEITDFHMRLREQRIKPLTLSLACTLAACLSLWVGEAPLVLRILAVVGFFQIAFLLVITLRWKISGHGAAIASFAVFLLGIYGNLAAPALLAIPLVAWARLRLNRHDLPQTIAGSFAGAFFMALLLFWI
jgi:hypothetical protein